MIMFDYRCCHASCSLSSSLIRDKSLIHAIYLNSLFCDYESSPLHSPPWLSSNSPSHKIPPKKFLSKNTGEPEDLGLGAPTAPTGEARNTFPQKKWQNVEPSGGMFGKGRFKVFQPSIFLGVILVFVGVILSHIRHISPRVWV